MRSEQLEAVRLKFASGNGIPVERASITRDEWDGIEALLAARSQTAADRAMLLNLMEQFDTQAHVCPRCGEEEDCDTMDMANELREYLRAAALQSIATAQQEPRAGNGEGFSLEFKYGFLAFGRSVPFNSNPYGCGTRESCQWDSGWQAARNDEVKAYEL